MIYLPILLFSLILSGCAETTLVRPRMDYVDTARVLYADPIYETEQVTRPIKECSSDDRYCEYVDRTKEEKRITGYRVTYKYQGRTFVTHTERRPADTIPIGVTVDPIR